MANIRTPNACTSCGSKNIGVKDQKVRTKDMQLVLTCWAYCKVCGRKGANAVCDNNITRDEEVDLAYRMWDQTIE